MSAYYGLGLGLGGAPVPIRGPHIALGGLIEQYTGAAAAYSLRALRNNIGNVVNVRRSSDDAERAFTAQEVSDGTLVDWVNTNFNVKTYDFSSDAGGFAAPDNVTLEGGESIAGIDDALKLSVVSTGSNTVHRTYQNLTPLGEGSGLRITFKAYRPSSNVDAGNLGFSFSQGFLRESIGPLFCSEDDTWEDFIFNTVSGNGTRLYLQLSATDGDASTKFSFTGTTGDHVYIKDLKIDVINSSGFVETWYDQSGNGRHATQSTEASQPKIVDGGALVVDGEENPSPFFDGIDDFLSVYTGDSTSEFSSFVAASFLLDTSKSGRIVSLTSGENSFTDNISGNIIPHIRDSENQSVASFSSGFFGISSITYGNLFLHSCILNTGTASNFLDGLFSGSKSVSYSLTDRSILLGRGEDRYLKGNISCYVLYDADQSANRAAIEANIADQYGITLA